MSYRNLENELKRKGVEKEKLAEYLHLSQEELENKIVDKEPFTKNEMMFLCNMLYDPSEIKEVYFFYLFFPKVI